MKKVLVRADDLGFSKAINYGIYEAVHNGIIRSVGVMVNMPDTLHGLELLKDEQVCFGQHTNICVGRPVCDPKTIPSLCGDNGEFKSSKEYRQAYKEGRDFVRLEEVIMEIEAQYHRFVELVGEKPHYFEGHAVESNNFSRGLAFVAEKYGLDYQPFSSSETRFRHTKLRVVMESTGEGSENYDPFVSLKKTVDDYPDDECGLLICHPGYLDQYILGTSSLTFNRTREVDMCTDEETKRWLTENEVRLLTYDDLL